jgi:hypothetical protein
MADEKKPEVAPPKPGDPFRDIIIAIFALLILSYFVNGVIRGIGSSRILSHGWSGLTPHGLLVSRTRSVNSLANPIGARVVNTATGDVVVYDSAAGLKIGTQKSEAEGTIVQGPVEVAGQRYWYVDYLSGTDGWVKESDIGYLESDPISSQSKPVGKRVINTRTTPVENATGTQELGSQPAGARGVIDRGPNTIDGETYWHVDYDSGTDGWVRESDLGYVEHSPSFLERIILGLYSGWHVIVGFSIVLTVLLAAAVAYIYRRLDQLRTSEALLLYPSVASAEAAPINPKWQRVLDHIESNNENDWRLSILEADIMLDDLLDTLNLPGDTMGEKLKAVAKGDFKTLDNAWEAHKVRNQIAHEGSDFILTQREARRIVELYRSIFEEFKIV